MAAKLACDVTGIIKVGAHDNDLGCTFDWSLRWLNIKKEWWLVVVILSGVISVVLSIQRELNTSLLIVIRGWRNT
jgi:hypothetical protein